MVLKLLDTIANETHFLYEGINKVGRATDNQIIIDPNYLEQTNPGNTRAAILGRAFSRHHFEIRVLDSESARIKDCRSSNGTFLNKYDDEHKIGTEEQPINEGDSIIIGNASKNKLYYYSFKLVGS